MKKLLVIMCTLLSLGAYSQKDFKVGATYVPFRHGFGISTKMNKMYYNYEFGSYRDGWDRHVIGRLHKVSITREFYTGKKECANRSLFVGLGYQHFYDKKDSFVRAGDFPISLEFGINAKFDRMEGILSFSFFEGVENDIAFEGKIGILYRIGGIVPSIRKPYWKLKSY
jgi:hypothetical protein